MPYVLCSIRTRASSRLRINFDWCAAKRSHSSFDNVAAPSSRTLKVGEFSLSPKGDYHIAVCLGTACYVKGSGLIYDKFQELLGIAGDECTEDRKFSLTASRCIGACGLAPVLTVNEDVYGRLTVDDVPGILAKYN